jgi:glycosyltransferase involved in cell wall biosynthesis
MNNGLAIVAPAYGIDSRMAGIGLRAWEFAQVASRELPVTIIARQRSDLCANNVSILGPDDFSLSDLIERHTAFLFYDMPDTRIMLAAHRAGKAIVSDCSVPIEHLEYSRIRNDRNPDCRYGELVNRFRLQALVTDRFIVRSDVYRTTLPVALSLVGRLSYEHYNRSAALDHLFSYVPIGFNAASAQHAAGVAPGAPMVDFTWSGGIWDFYDPVALVEAVAMLDRMGTPVTVRFMYARTEGQVLKESERLHAAVAEQEVSHLIEFAACPPRHYERDAVIKSGSALVCLGRRGIENFTSVRLRLRDSFLYRMPLIVDKYGATGELVRRMKIGIAVDAEDTTEIAQALLTMKTESIKVREFTKNIACARPEFEIDAAVREVTRWIRSGARAPDAGTQWQNDLIQAVLVRHPELEESPDYPF